jgi:hypothetical protein
MSYTATASQTTFATSGYTVGYVDVYLNGVKLSTSDFTATNGSDVVLGSGAAAGDVLAVVMKNDHSDLVALPITDSQGNNVLSESGGVVTLTADEANVGSNALVVDSSGDVLVGASSSLGARFNVEHPTDCIALNLGPSTSGTRFFMYFTYNGTNVGSIQGTSSSTQFATSSDYRLKQNITDITDGIARVKQLNPLRFNFIVDPENTVDGFIAHEVQDIVPEAISGEKDAVNEDGSIRPQGIDQSKLVPLLTAALREAIALIESQQFQIDALTTRIEALEATP